MALEGQTVRCGEREQVTHIEIMDVNKVLRVAEEVWNIRDDFARPN